MFSRNSISRVFSVLLIVVIMLSVLIGNAAFPTRARAASIITVNSTADVAADDGQCTLREAITSANTNAASGVLAGECIAGMVGADTIIFSVGGGGAQTINLASGLSITESVVIDGTSQPVYAGTPLIRINSGLFDIFSVQADNSTIKGLVLTGANSAIVLTVGTSGAHIENNYIGTDGSVASGNVRGIYIEGSNNNTIGGVIAGQGNIISGNSYGIMFNNAASGNLIQGNIIGTNATGDAAIANLYGILLLTDSGANTIDGNLISGNSMFGVKLYNSTSGSMVKGNLIGLNAAGNAAIANNVGVSIDATSGVTVGGTTLAERNVISGNTGQGILITNSGGYGLPANTLIQGNYIGTNITGMSAIANNDGIVNAGSATTIGGTVAGAGNLISGNAYNGIYSLGTTLIVQGNKIGTNAAGTAAIGNGMYGIELGNGSATIGGSVAGAGNLISGNGGGIWQRGASVSDVSIKGNYIGTNAAGSSAIGNGSGIYIERGTGLTIGGSATGEGNLISGNATGIYIYSNSSSGTTIYGNKIGTDASGVFAVANTDGIGVDNGQSVTIGNIGTGQGNLISGNTNNGIYITTLATGSIQGNMIGANAAGTGTLSNGWGGIVLGNASVFMVSGNLIAHHNGSGDYAISLVGGSDFSASSVDNCIIDNDQGVYSNGGPTFIYNWWDDSSGPYNLTYNPSALGDPVSDNITFSPWLTMPPAACEILYALAAPFGLTATSISQTQIDLLWMDKSTHEVSFRIERSTDGSSDWAEIDSVGAGVTTYSDTSLICGTNRFYRVKVRNADGDSTYSNTSSATTSGCDTTVPTAVSSVLASSNPTSAASVDFTMTFSELVTGVDTVAPFNDFALTNGPGIIGAFVTGVTPISGTTYTVSVNTGSGNGSIRLDVVDNNSIVDSASNPLGGAAMGDGDFTTGQVYDIEKLPILTVVKVSTGIGTVTSSPAGINCGLDCSETYDAYTVVMLTATSAAGSMFSGWSGACSGTGSCVVSMTGDKSVTATFAPKLFNDPGKWTSSFDLSHGWTVSQFVRTVGDVNNDGRDDLIGFGLDGVYVALSNGSGFGAVSKWSSSFDLSHGWTVSQFVRTVGDVNNDGRDDLIGFGLDGVYVALSNGTSFSAISKWTSSFDLSHGWTVSQFVRTVGDVNNDGRDDLIGFGLDGVYVALSNGTSFDPISKWTSSFDLSHGWTVSQFVRTVGDVNFDGRDDLIGFGLDGVYVALSNGTSFDPISKWTSSFDLSHGWTVSGFVRTVGDVNNDGRDDLIGFGQDGVYVALSNGASFDSVSRWTNDFDLSHGWTVSQFVRTVGDVNNDGKADLVGFGLDGVYVGTAK
ncbi:MAG: CSLREA domain-containing protein [Anaerolineales bacterium]|nr:CSLREA domain-containing protein [Anaerolineales bacterium]